MPTHPHIHFRGNCAEALTTCARIFGAPPPQMMRFGEAPDASEAAKASDRLIHGQVQLFDGTLMASDFPPGDDGKPQSGFSVMQSAPDLATGERIFDALCRGGTVIQAGGPVFFAKAFGTVRDRFGARWIITVANEAA
jgi:PhnB protein